MTRIGVTGHSSFLGKHLVQRLRDMGRSFRLFDGDIRNPAQVADFVRQCETIYHLAGCNRGTERDVYEVNMIGGANVIAASAAIGNRHIIFPSSNYVTRFPSHPYSVSKKALENMLDQFSVTPGCRATVFRLPNVYGPMALPFHVSVVATFCWYEATGMGHMMPILGDGSQAIEIIPVTRIVEALVSALESGPGRSLVELKGDTFSIAELAEIIRTPAKRRDYPALEETVRFFEGKHPLFEVSRAQFDRDRSGRAEIAATDGSCRLCRCLERTLEPGYQRCDFETLKEGWVFVAAGRVALDIFEAEQYWATVLLDGENTAAVRLSCSYTYKLRNVSAESAAVEYFVADNR